MHFVSKQNLGTLSPGAECTSVPAACAGRQASVGASGRVREGSAHPGRQFATTVVFSAIAVPIDDSLLATNMALATGVRTHAAIRERMCTVIR